MKVDVTRRQDENKDGSREKLILALATSPVPRDDVAIVGESITLALGTIVSGDGQIVFPQ